MLLVVGCASVGCVFSESESESEENDRQGSNSTWFFLPGSATALKSKWLVFGSDTETDTDSGSDLQMPLFLVYERSLCRLVSSAATLSIPAMEYR